MTMQPAPETRITTLKSHEGYGVTPDGRVWSCRSNSGKSTNKWHPLKVAIDRYGYHKVTLYDKGAVRYATVHRLVIEAYIGAIPEGLQVNHLNGVKTDNRLQNLEVVTASGNAIHAISSGLWETKRGSRNGSSKLSEGDISEILKLSRDGATTREIAEKFGITECRVSRIRQGHAWKHVEGDRFQANELHVKGETHWNASITEAQAISIIHRGRSGEQAASIAESMGLSTKKVRRILKGETWKHLDRTGA